MTNIVVVDANIALKWVLKEEDSDTAEALLTEWSNRKIVILAPSLLIYESANILYQNVRRGTITPDRAKEALGQLLDMKLKLDFPLAPDLSIRAIELAHHFKLPATYDSHYLALAEHEGCELWTADTQLWNSIQGKLTWVRLMSDFSAS